MTVQTPRVTATEPSENEAIRVGVVFPGDPSAPSTWSGTPRGVLDGLLANQVKTVPVTAMPGPRLHRLTLSAVALGQLRRSLGGGLRETLKLSLALSRNTPAMSAVYTRAANSALGRLRDLDGAVQIGTGYALDVNAPVVTYEDITIMQAVEHGYPDWRALSKRALKRRVDLQRRAYDHAQACCAATTWTADSMINDYDVSPEKVHVVGVGRNHSVKRPTNRDWSVPRYLFVGWDWQCKNGPTVLAAFARVRAEVPEATLDIVGRHPHFDQDGVQDHGLLRLDDPPSRDRMQSLYRRATCYVMPSRCEGAGIAYVEAAHAGLPSIGTAVGGGPYLIGDGGAVVRPGDEDALVEAMMRFGDPQYAAQAGAAAFERSRLFTWANVGSRLMRALGR